MTVSETGFADRAGSDNDVYNPRDGWRYGFTVGTETATRTTTTHRTSSWLGFDALAADPGSIISTRTENLSQPTLVAEV